LSSVIFDLTDTNGIEMRGVTVLALKTKRRIGIRETSQKDTSRAKDIFDSLKEEFNLIGWNMLNHIKGNYQVKRV
jgi:hypothetical protein